jgi:hypothetical protein
LLRTINNIVIVPLGFEHFFERISKTFFLIWFVIKNIYNSAK